jgi:chromate transporter
MAQAGAHAGIEPWRLFRVFLRIGVTSLGGGASAHIREAVVVRNEWLDEDRFVEAMTVARSLPGTNVSNLAAFVGMTLGGPAGAILAVVGIVVPGGAVVLGLAAAYVHVGRHTHLMRAGLHGLSVGATGVMVVLALQAMRAGCKRPSGLLVALAAFVAVAVLNLSVVWALAVLLPIASLLPRAPA